jgi:hypothetical protein
MAPLSKVAILAAITRRERVIPAPVFEGALLARELSRPDYEACRAFAATEDVDSATGMAYLDLWRWHAAIIAHGLVDPESGEAFADGRRDPETGQVPIDPATRSTLFTPDEVVTWPNRGALENGMAELAQAILDLNEVGEAGEAGEATT